MIDTLGEGLREFGFLNVEGHGLDASLIQGTYELWRDCGGTDSDIVTLAVRPDGADRTVLVLAQLVEPADAAALDHALATLSLRD